MCVPRKRYFTLLTNPYVRAHSLALVCATGLNGFGECRGREGVVLPSVPTLPIFYFIIFFLNFVRSPSSARDFKNFFSIKPRESTTSTCTVELYKLS